MAKVWKILIGPASFFLSAFLLWGTFTPAASFAIATAVWMALWWIIRPVSIYVTAFVPIVVNAFFNLIPNSHVISQYFSEIAVMLLGSDLICLTWTTTGLDKRVSVKALCFIGTSMKNQIFVWFLASTVLSIFLPNVVVAAIFCPIAVAMLRSVGEDDVTESRMALPILLAIGWGHEFMYYDWVIRFLPLLAIVFLLNLIFLWLIPAPAKDLPGTRAYFREMYSKFGTMRRGEKIGLYLFILATALAFIRPLFASFLPAMKPAYVFLVIGMLMFFLHDENGKTMLDWQYAESHAMWGMIFLFASGLALGRLVIETGAIDRLAVIIVGLQLPPGLMTMAISCTFACFLSELSSNTAAASISIPVVTGITGVMGVNPIPYILGTIVAANCAYILPVSTRAIPVGYGLNPSLQIKYGIRLYILTCATTIIICTLFMNYSPLFNEL